MEPGAGLQVLSGAGSECAADQSVRVYSPRSYSRWRRSGARKSFVAVHRYNSMSPSTQSSTATEASSSSQYRHCAPGRQPLASSTEAAIAARRPGSRISLARARSFTSRPGAAGLAIGVWTAMRGSRSRSCALAVRGMRTTNNRPSDTCTSTGLIRGLPSRRTVPANAK